MLKHATISRTNRAQQTLRLQQQHQINQQLLQSVDQQDVSNCSATNISSTPESPVPVSEEAAQHVSCNRGLDESDGHALANPITNIEGLHNSEDLLNNNLPFAFKSISPLTTCQSATSTPKKQRPSDTESIKSSPRGSIMQSPSTLQRINKCTSESMIKIFAQTLSQDVEYVTVHVNAQTKTNQIIKNLLRKFRLKHRDPNLFYLTLERWIRKDGLKHKSMMLLGDEACPLQLQQCCSNPPHNDIKFTLQTRTGVLVKIFCSDVVPDAQYKCLSLSTQTTVEETIELMLHCLNLNVTNQCNTSTTNEQSHSLEHNLHPREAGSPGSTGSFESSNSSSSGIESDPNSNNRITRSPLPNAEAHDSSQRSHHHQHQIDSEMLDPGSRTSSVTSISSNLSSSTADRYCLVIECKTTHYKRTLDSDEYLVDVYQNLISRTMDGQTNDGNGATNSNANNSISNEQWFLIKLKQRDDYSRSTIMFTNPRQNIPLPPIPNSAGNFTDANSLHQIVSTTQIEVNSRPSIYPPQVTASSGSRTPATGKPAASSESKVPPPPAFISLVPVRPHRRNLSNASSTFGRPLNSINRRRYDPAQLAEDLNKLDFKEFDDLSGSNRPLPPVQPSIRYSRRQQTPQAHPNNIAN